MGPSSSATEPGIEVNVYGDAPPERALGRNNMELSDGPLYPRSLSIQEIDVPRQVPSLKIWTKKVRTFSGYLRFTRDDERGCVYTTKDCGKLFEGVFLDKFQADDKPTQKFPTDSEFYPILKDLLSNRLRWGTDFSFSGLATFMSGLSDWTQRIIDQYEDTLRRAEIYGLVAISRFPYLYHKDVWRAFCELWSPLTNTLHHAGGELGISLHDLKQIAGLPILGDPYEEFLPPNEQLSDESKFPPTVLELLRIHADLCKRWKKDQIFWKEWIDYFYRDEWNLAAFEGTSGIELQPKQAARKDSVRYIERQRTTNLPRMIASHQGELAAFLALMLSRFVLPQTSRVVRPETFVMACFMARGTRVSLAPTVLAHIYHGLNKMATHPTYPGRANPSFGIHFVIGWLSEYFPCLYRAHDDKYFSKDYPLLRRCIGLQVENCDLFKARLILRHQKHVRYRTIPFGERDDLDRVDTGGLSDIDFERLLCIRSAVLPIQMGRTLTLEPYYPNRFARQFGFDQGVAANALQFGFPCRVRRSLGDIAEYYSCFFQRSTGEIFHIPNYSVHGKCTRGYCTWWVTASAPYLSQSVQKVNVTLSGNKKTLLRDPIYVIEDVRKVISGFKGLGRLSRVVEPPSHDPLMSMEMTRENSENPPIPVKVLRRRSESHVRDDVHFKRHRASSSPTSSGEFSDADKEYVFGTDDTRDLINPIEQPPVDEEDHAANDDSDFEVGSECDLHFGRSPSPDMESTPLAAPTQDEIMPVAESQPLEEDKVGGSLCSDDQPSTEKIDYEVSQELEFDVSKPSSPALETPPLAPTQIDPQLQPLIQDSSDAVSIKKASESLQALLPASVTGSVRGFLISGVKEVVDILSSSLSSRALLAKNSQVLGLLGMLQGVAQQAKVNLYWFVKTVEGVLHDAEASSKLEANTDVEIVERLSTQLAQHASALELHQAQVPCLAQRSLDLQKRREALLLLKKQVCEVEASIDSDSAALEADSTQLQGFIQEDEAKIRLLKDELNQAGFARMTELKLIEERRRAWISELTDFSSSH